MPPHDDRRRRTGRRQDGLGDALVKLAGSFDLEIVNVYDDPDRALRERVLVTPTLLAPDSARRLVGDLSETAQLHYFLHGLAPG